MKRKHLLPFVLLCGALLPAPLRAGYFTWTMIDVGNGEANYIKLPNGKDVIIDGGHPADGASVLVPFMESLPDFDGVIDYMVATHEDADHYGGLEALLGRFEVLKVYSPRAAAGTYFNDHFAVPVAAEGCPWIVRGAADAEASGGTSPGKFDIGCRLDWDPEVSVRCLSVGSEATTNKNSIVLKMDYGESGFLFTGDLSYNAVIGAILANYGADVPSDIHKVSHHGSASDDANSEAWINAVHSLNSGYALISCIGSVYHPSPLCLDRLKARGAAIYMTFLDGTTAVAADSAGNYTIMREHVWDGSFKDPTQSTRAAYPPALPAGLRVTGQSGSGVTLDWDDVTADSSGSAIPSGSVRYDVFRSTMPGGDPGAGTYVQPGMGDACGIYEKLTSTPVAGSSYTDTALTPGETYYYRVSAIRTDHYYERRYSNEASTAGPVPPPPTPIPPSPRMTVTLNSASPVAGDLFTADVTVNSTDGRWDGYVAITGARGVYSVVQGALQAGIKPMVKNMAQIRRPLSARVLSMTVPPGVPGDYEIIVAVLPAGLPPTMANAQKPGSLLAVVPFRVPAP